MRVQWLGDSVAKRTAIFSLCLFKWLVSGSSSTSLHTRSRSDRTQVRFPLNDTMIIFVRQECTVEAWQPRLAVGRWRQRDVTGSNVIDPDRAVATDRRHASSDTCSGHVMWHVMPSPRSTPTVTPNSIHVELCRRTGSTGTTVIYGFSLSARPPPFWLKHTGRLTASTLYTVTIGPRLFAQKSVVKSSPCWTLFSTSVGIWTTCVTKCDKSFMTTHDVCVDFSSTVTTCAHSIVQARRSVRCSSLLPADEQMWPQSAAYQRIYSRRHKSEVIHKVPLGLFCAILYIEVCRHLGDTPSPGQTTGDKISGKG